MSFSRFLLERSPVNLMEEDKVIEFLDNILTKCKPFLKHKQPLYRGANKSSHGYMGSNTIRTDRKPRDTSKGAHMFFNDRLKQLGLPSREEVLFTTPNLDFSYEFGETYLIFPIGNFKFFWINNITDLTEALEESEAVIDEYVNFKGSPQEFLTHLHKKLDDMGSDLTNEERQSNKMYLRLRDGARVVSRLIKQMGDYTTSNLPPRNDRNEVSIVAKDYYYINVDALYYELYSKNNEIIYDKVDQIVTLLNIKSRPS